MKLAALLALAACAPAPFEPEWLVTKPRLLAVKAEPPEVSPGAHAHFTLLAAGPDGPLDASAAVWSRCDEPPPLTERGAVSPGCLGDLQASPSATVATSVDACSRFGPIAAPDVQRAREADATGGYYQPIRASLFGEQAFALERLLCPLSQASFQIAQAYAKTYVPNQNPSITAFTAPAAAAAGSAVDLALSWAASDEEQFPMLDAASFALVAQRETLSVAWFATGGTLAEARTAAGTNRWTAPQTPGFVYLWAVLRDSRGGLDFASLRIEVQPR